MALLPFGCQEQTSCQVAKFPAANAQSTNRGILAKRASDKKLFDVIWHSSLFWPTFSYPLLPICVQIRMAAASDACLCQACLKCLALCAMHSILEAGAWWWPCRVCRTLLRGKKWKTSEVDSNCQYCHNPSRHSHAMVCWFAAPA